MAVEFAFQALCDPASVEMNDSPPSVFASVTRKMDEPKVGSLITEFAGPSAGAGGTALASVPVYAEYVDGADCAFKVEYRPLTMTLKTTAIRNLKRYAKPVFIRFLTLVFQSALDTCRLALLSKQSLVVCG
jgi:hypothetical protein